MIAGITSVPAGNPVAAELHSRVSLRATSVMIGRIRSVSLTTASRYVVAVRQ